jgi:hypothetical protein
MHRVREATDVDQSTSGMECSIPRALPFPVPAHCEQEWEIMGLLYKQVFFSKDIDILDMGFALLLDLQAPRPSLKSPI